MHQVDADLELLFTKQLLTLQSINVSISASFAGEFGWKDENSSESFYAKLRGGTAIDCTSYDSLCKNYQTWLVSFKDGIYNEIVDFPDKSLISIWELLPNSDSYLTPKKYLEETTNQLMDEEYLENLNSFNDPIDEDYQDGTVLYPYLISNINQLRNIESDMEACYKLVNNLDLSNYPNWNPIGINNENVTPFRGNLNGNGYSIFGLNRNSILPFDTDTNAYMGLFGRIENALIINLKLMDINYTFDCSQLNIKNSHCLVGGLAGSSINSEIRNIKVTGTMNIGSRAARFDNTQFQFCGGIIGEATSTNILYCGSAVDIHATYRYQSIGGIIGSAVNGEINVKNSYNTGDFYACSSNYSTSRTAYTGGIIGEVYANNGSANVMNCYSVSKMQVKGGYLKSMGGIIGCYDITNIGSKIINCPYFLYGCYNNGNESYSIIKEAVNVTSFQGDFIEKESFLNGIPLSCLPVYSKDAYENDSNCCWIYQNGQFPKLYWE